MVKASWVLLATGESAQKLSARNQLRGTVCKIVRGAVNAEVAVELSGGTVVTAIVTNGSIDSLELEIGRPVVAIFKASSVIIGVAS
jgi:molybdate transport system regulatory protein